ncbi:hypothetical protein F383_37563 [Gossypium arboreum]|uniref:Uncharacterized protein n=1 Tax=Gossypium arboreum TaxID=29729 RepID=A0A0B0MD18_GOSAR|nr:hypothetical protein F383_37563 [Gossypium arboreum]
MRVRPWHRFVIFDMCL